VLSAGAIHSPAILLRSGIGPTARLRDLGIPMVKDLPAVGSNLMDHPIIRATLKLKPNLPMHATLIAASPTAAIWGGGGERDMIFIAFNHRLSIGPEPAPTCAVGASVYDVFSRGELQLASPDSEIDPVVEENVLSDARDRLRMRDAARRLTDRASGVGRLLRLDPLGRH
jgi:5-(hydroxymethyl)furfural/furfural oxidase